MINQKTIVVLIPMLVITIIVSLGGCKSSSPLAAFQPEIVNNPDNFQFQATKVQNVTTTLQYTWSNSGTRATINHSSAVTLGAATIQILDGNSIEVYSSPLLSTGTPASSTGVAGNWTIKVVLTNCYGTLNFRVQML